MSPLEHDPQLAGPMSFCPMSHCQCPAQSSFTLYYGTGKPWVRVCTWMLQSPSLPPPIHQLSFPNFHDSSFSYSSPLMTSQAQTHSSFLTHLINGEISSVPLPGSVQGFKCHLCTHGTCQSLHTSQDCPPASLLEHSTPISSETHPTVNLATPATEGPLVFPPGPHCTDLRNILPT